MLMILAVLRLVGSPQLVHFLSEFIVLRLFVVHSQWILVTEFWHAYCWAGRSNALVYSARIDLFSSTRCLWKICVYHG